MNQEQTLVNLDDVLTSSPEIKQNLDELASRLFFIPFMTQAKFAESIGLTKGVIGGWIDLDSIPTVKIDKHRMINMVVLVANLKEGKVL